MIFPVILCTAAAAATTPVSERPTPVAATMVPAPGPSDTVAALKAALARTPIDQITCGMPGNLCEVVSGKSVFYTDPAAKTLVIGHVYDLQAHVDLTERKLAELKQVVAASDGHGSTHPAPGESTTEVERISLKGLTHAGAVEWGPASGEPVTIFTDFHCPYCRALVHELESLDLRVTEYPISILGSRNVAEQVICAPDRVSAMRNAYAGVPLPARTCDTHGLDANEAFARLHGFNETPIIVRRDGAVLRGFREAAVLSRWIAESSQ